MLAPDIRGEQARPDREPADVPAREEVVGAHVLLAARSPVADPKEDQEVRGDDEEIERGDVAHGVTVQVGEAARADTPRRGRSDSRAAHPNSSRNAPGA